MSPIPMPKTKLVGGLLIPETDPGNWLLRDGMVNGYPAYQYDRLEAAVGFCKQRRTVIDGGAHIGSWSVHLASLFSKVLAFEPVPDNANCFAANLAPKSNVLLYRTALSDDNGLITMLNKGSKSVSWAPHCWVGNNGITASCVSLDSFRLTDVDLIKLDVEGGEYKALLGSIKTIKACKPVIIIEEKHDPSYAASRFLLGLGMMQQLRMKNDIIFTWEE